MEEAKAAAYYDELTKKGEGAARFKQGLGFSTTNSSSSFPSKSTSNSNSSSLFSGFVRAGTTTTTNSSLEPKPPRPRSRSPSRHRHRSRSRERERGSRRSDSYRRRPWSRSRSRSPSRRRRSRSPSRRSRRRSRSGSPSNRRAGRDGYGDRDSSTSKSGGGDKRRRAGGVTGKVDYSRIIDGYDKMTPAERVKAKLKLQLSETAAKDSTIGTTGWSRFEFDKDAPLDNDDDAEIEAAADDDASLVKDMGKTFRLSAVESKREEVLRDAHEEAMFGVPTYSVLESQPADVNPTNSHEHKEEDVDQADSSSSLINDKIFAVQQGSWRDRAQKFRRDMHS